MLCRYAYNEKGDDSERREKLNVLDCRLFLGTLHLCTRTSKRRLRCHWHRKLLAFKTDHSLQLMGASNATLHLAVLLGELALAGRTASTSRCLIGSLAGLACQLVQAMEASCVAWLLPLIRALVSMAHPTSAHTRAGGEAAVAGELAAPTKGVAA